MARIRYIKWHCGDVPSLIVQFIVYAIINPPINHSLSFCSSINQSQDNLIIKIAELLCDWLKDEQNIEEQFISGSNLVVLLALQLLYLSCICI